MNSKHLNYKQTPPGIKYILQLFHDQKLNYVLFKCEHIFMGKNKNLDILFETKKDYNKAAQILEQNGFSIHLSEKIEKYKMMYCGFYQGILYSIHLHSEIAWHGIKALDKKTLFDRKIIITPIIIIPGIEDSILIHAAHIIFENFRITEKEKVFLDQINDPQLDHQYIKKQIKNNRWEAGFKFIIKNKERTLSLSKSQIFQIWSNKLIYEPKTIIYLSKKMFRKLFQTIKQKRQGCLIALIGTNGSGKSTLTRKILERYEQPISHLGLNQTYYYYGWKPTFFLTKLMSYKMQKKNKRLFQKMNLQSKIKNFDLKQEFLFAYLYFEFYYRYRKEILKLLKKRQLVVCDRFFYDMYGQYPYARNSILIKPLLKVFPKPDFTYVLDVDEEFLQKRQKTDKEQKKIQFLNRRVFPVEYLQQQRNNFHFLAQFLPGRMIDTNKNINQCVQQIINDTWRKLL